jgi:DNA polymerase-3 subunit beta
MRVTCNREQLLRAFSNASSVVQTRSPKAVLQNVKMIAGDGVTLQATDLELSIQVEAHESEVQFPGEVLLHAVRVGQILRECPDETIVVSVEGNEILLTTQSSKFKLPSADPAEYPVKPPAIEGGYHVVPARFLSDAIRRTIFATDVDSSRFALGGILFEMNDDVVTITATDGRRLANVVGKGEAVGGHSTASLNCIVPVRAASVIRKAIPEDGSVHVSFTTSSVVVQADGVAISARLVEGRYPNWKQVLPSVESFPLDIEMPAGAFDSLVRQAAITADAESRGLDFQFRNGTLSASAAAASTGRSNVSMPIAFDGDELPIKLDYRYLRDFIATLDPSSSFRVQLTSSNSSALLSCEGYKYVVMPMALEK